MAYIELISKNYSTIIYTEDRIKPLQSLQDWLSVQLNKGVLTTLQVEIVRLTSMSNSGCSLFLGRSL